VRLHQAQSLFNFVQQAADIVRRLTVTPQLGHARLRCGQLLLHVLNASVHLLENFGFAQHAGTAPENEMSAGFLWRKPALALAVPAINGRRGMPGLGITATGKLRFRSQQPLQAKAGALGVPGAPRPAQYRRLSITLSDVSVILSQSFFAQKAGGGADRHRRRRRHRLN
jgi:hypothetical protein